MMVRGEGIRSTVRIVRPPEPKIDTASGKKRNRQFIWVEVKHNFGVDDTGLEGRALQLKLCNPSASKRAHCSMKCGLTGYSNQSYPAAQCHLQNFKFCIE